MNEKWKEQDGASLLKDIYALSTCSHNQEDDVNSREGEALSGSSYNQECTMEAHVKDKL